MFNINWQNIITRAAWSFVQGAIGAAGLIAIVPTDFDSLKNAGLALVAGGIASVVSFIKTVISEIVVPTISLRANEVASVPTDALIGGPAATVVT